jgi:hypothetical protein
VLLRTGESLTLDLPRGATRILIEKEQGETP